MVLFKKCFSKWLDNRRFAIWTACLMAFLLRIGVSLALRTYQFKAAHSRFEYWTFGYEWGQIARWLIDIGMYSLDGKLPTTETDPFYVFIIALFFKVFGTFKAPAAVALILFQSLLCAISTWALFVLAEKLYGPFEARLSSLLFACYPASIFFAVGRIAPSSLSILLLCLIFIVVLDLPSSQRLSLAALGGLLMGLLILTSSKPLSLFIIIPLWLLIVGKGKLKRMILIILIFIGTSVIVILPWSFRNSLVLERASFSKTNLGFHLWIGNNPDATGYFYSTTLNDYSFEFEERRQSIYFNAAVYWIKNNPKDFLILTLKRIKYFWYQIPKNDTGTKESLHKWVFLIILGLALAGVIWPGERFERVWLLLLFFGIFPIVFYLTHIEFYRHRFHIEPFIIILSSHGLYKFWVMIKMKCRSMEI